MEIKREPVAPSDFRVRQLQARDMLRGDLDDDALEKYVQQSVLTTTVEKAVSWSQGNSIYPMTFGLACCAIEMISLVGMRVDIGRFGWEAFWASPRQADLLILSGRVSVKMAPVVRRIYDQMLEPKWAISMGACCSSMGVFNNYALVPSDKFMPIDVHVPGCPPRPEALMHGILRLRDKIQGNAPDGWRERYHAVGTEEVLTPEHIAAQEKLLDAERGARRDPGDARQEAQRTAQAGVASNGSPQSTPPITTGYGTEPSPGGSHSA